MISAAAFTLLMIIENPPFASGPAIIEDFQTAELCHAQAAKIKKSFESMSGPRNNFRFVHDCIQVEKSQ